jgi:hypothetical protein
MFAERLWPTTTTFCSVWLSVRVAPYAKSRSFDAGTAVAARAVMMDEFSDHPHETRDR